MSLRCSNCGFENCNCGTKNEVKSKKATNPKDAVGIRKVPLSVVPLTVVAELGIAMMEGARKYGRHNYRVDGVRASVYVDAVFRHLSKWWEGEDKDPDSGLSHIIKAIASLAVLRDSMIQKNWVDDRPPSSPDGFLLSLDKLAEDLIERYPNAKDAFLNTGKKEEYCSGCHHERDSCPTHDENYFGD